MSSSSRPSDAAWTAASARAFLGDWRENGNASKARAHLAAALDALDTLRDAWNSHMATCPQHAASRPSDDARRST